MIIGFTGTRKGLSSKQMMALDAWVKENESHITGLLHGCAIGADVWMVRRIKACSKFIPVYGYPCHIEKDTAKDAIKMSDTVYRKARPLDRNRTIVSHCARLIACPALMEEEQRSGTWATIRYARKEECAVTIFWPDGTITHEEPKAVQVHAAPIGDSEEEESSD